MIIIIIELQINIIQNLDQKKKKKLYNDNNYNEPIYIIDSIEYSSKFRLPTKAQVQLTIISWFLCLVLSSMVSKMIIIVFWFVSLQCFVS